MLSALGDTREIWLLQRYLERSIDENYIRKQDSSIVFSSAAGNIVGYNVAREFFYNRIKDIHKK